MEFKTIIKENDVLFKVYNVYTEKGNFLVLEDGEYVEKPVYALEEKREEVSLDVLENEYKTVFDEYTSEVSEVEKLKEQIFDREENIEDYKVTIQMYENVLPEDKHLEVEEESDDEEEDDEE